MNSNTEQTKEINSLKVRIFDISEAYQRCASELQMVSDCLGKVVKALGIEEDEVTAEKILEEIKKLKEKKPRSRKPKDEK